MPEPQDDEWNTVVVDVETSCCSNWMTFDGTSVITFNTLGVDLEAND